MKPTILLPARGTPYRYPTQEAEVEWMVRTGLPRPWLRLVNGAWVPPAVLWAESTARCHLPRRLRKLDEVRQIRLDYWEGIATISQLAERHGLSRPAVYGIVRAETHWYVL